MRGDVHWYVAQAIPQIDAEIAEKGHFWMETSLTILSRQLGLQEEEMTDIMAELVESVEKIAEQRDKD